MHDAAELDRLPGHRRPPSAMGAPVPRARSLPMFPVGPALGRRLPFGSAATPIPRRLPRGSRLRRAAWWTGAILSAGVAAFSFRYVLHLGVVPPNIAANRFNHPWIVLHAGGAATALLLAPLQLLPGLRRRRPRLHRWLGRCYVAGCAVGGVAALPLALGSVAGPAATASFLLLDAWWLSATALGLAAAIRGRIGTHRRWMIRSVAATFGAVTLRLYLPVSALLGIDFLLAYRAISWLAWVPNAVLAELILRRRPAVADQIENPPPTPIAVPMMADAS